jgi:cell division FtsZ-interacting protein ZapD
MTLSEMNQKTDLLKKLDSQHNQLSTMIEYAVVCDNSHLSSTLCEAREALEEQMTIILLEINDANEESAQCRRGCC